MAGLRHDRPRAKIKNSINKYAKMHRQKARTRDGYPVFETRRRGGSRAFYSCNGDYKCNKMWLLVNDVMASAVEFADDPSPPQASYSKERREHHKAEPFY
jgi:hypothetical protein